MLMLNRNWAMHTLALTIWVMRAQITRKFRAPDHFVSYACVPGSNPANPAWGFQRNIIVSPFSLGDNVR